MWHEKRMDVAANNTGLGSVLMELELSYTLNASTDYLLLERNPDRDQDRKQLLQVISPLSDIARNM